MYNNVLYFPSIHIRNAAWLKSALLLWDHVYRIVPEGFKTRDGNEAQECIDVGRLRSVALEKAELVEVADGYRQFLNKLTVLPDGLEDGRGRRIHRKKIEARLYPRLLETAHHLDSEGFLHFGNGTARGYMFHLAQVAARRRRLARASDDPDAWAVDSFFLGEGSFDRSPAPGDTGSSYGALILHDLLPGGIGNAPMSRILKLADKRRDERVELRAQIEALGEALAKVESTTHADDVFADFVLRMRRAKEDYRRSLGFGNKLDLYHSAAVALPAISGLVFSAWSLSEWQYQWVAAGVFIGAIAGYASYRHQQRKGAKSVGAYLLDMERNLQPKNMLGASRESFVEFMDD